MRLNRNSVSLSYVKDENHKGNFVNYHGNFKSELAKQNFKFYA